MAKKKPKRKVKIDYICSFEIQYLNYHSFSNIKEDMDTFLEDHNDSNLEGHYYHDVEVRVEDNLTIELYGLRYETDQEYDKRLTKNQKARETRQKNMLKKLQSNEDHEKAELKRLKEKYGD